MTLEGVLLTLNLDWLGDRLHVPLELVLKLAEGHAKHGLQVAHEAIHVPLPGNFVDDVFVVVITEAPTQFLVVHLWLVLPGSPTSRHLFWVYQLEFPLTAGPSDTVLAVAICQQLQ